VRRRHCPDYLGCRRADEGHQFDLDADPDRANTYTGSTTVSAGTLQAGATSAFGTNSAVSLSSGTTLDLAGFSNSIGSLAGTGGTVTNSSSPLQH